MPSHGRRLDHHDFGIECAGRDHHIERQPVSVVGRAGEKGHTRPIRIVAVEVNEGARRLSELSHFVICCDADYLNRFVVHDDAAPDS